MSLQYARVAIGLDLIARTNTLLHRQSGALILYGRLKKWSSMIICAVIATRLVSRYRRRQKH